MGRLRVFIQGDCGDLYKQSLTSARSGDGDGDITLVLVFFLCHSLFLSLIFSFIMKFTPTSVVMGKFTL